MWYIFIVIGLIGVFYIKFFGRRARQKRYMKLLANKIINLEHFLFVLSNLNDPNAPMLMELVKNDINNLKSELINLLEEN